MNNKLLTAVIYDENDATFFLKTKPNVDQILPITPNAQAILLEGGISFISTTEIYTDYRQARVLARVRRMERTFLSELEKEGHLGVAAKETLRALVHALCSISASFWELIKELGHCLLTDGKQWVQIADPKKIHQFLLEHLQPQIEKMLIPTVGVPISPLIVKMMNGLALSFWKGRSAVCFSDFDYGLKKFPHKKKKNFYSISLDCTKGGWKDTIQAMKFLWDTLRKKKTCSILVVPEHLSRSAAAVQKTLDTIRDPISWMGIKIDYEHLVKTTTLYDGLKGDVKKTIDKLEPHHIVAGQLRWKSAAVLAEVAKKYNIPVTLISHGSHTLHDSSVAAFEHQENAQGLLISPLSDITLLQSPHAEAYALKLYCTNGQRSRPIQWGTSKIAVTSSNAQTRHILHAGSYKQWVSPRPWIYETPDEFIKGLTSLILATSNINNTKLVIRMRTQPDCSLTNLQKLLPHGDHYEIKSSGSFSDDMSKADLLVSWSSTTIEEALHLRKPVLLWGGSSRYFHLPPCRKFPIPRNRSEVYAPETIDDLSLMIEAILESHAGKPLTDEELNNHVWPKNIPGVDEFTRQLGSRDNNLKSSK